MTRPTQAYREHYRRQHRVLGAYLALHCWHEGYDAVIIPRETLEHFLKLKRFTDEHLSWLTKDINPYFAFTMRQCYRGNREKFSGII